MSMRLRFAMTSCGIALAACAGGLPAPEGGNESRCVVGGSSGDRAKVASAISEATGIYEDPSFWARVGERVWLQTPTGPIVKGPDVAAMLSKVKPYGRGYNLSLLGGSNVPLFTGMTVASTARCGNVTLDRKHIDKLDMLVNTVSHENTHVAGTGAGEIGCDERGEPPDGGFDYRFQDGDYDDATKAWLVSYTVGDMAECHYRAHLGIEAYDVCMSRILDGTPLVSNTRREVECCACARRCEEQKLLREIRGQAPVCAAVSCEKWHCDDKCHEPVR